MSRLVVRRRGVRLYLGDCRAVLRRLKAESVDTIITDPPYHLTQASRRGSSRKPGTDAFGRHRVGQRGFMGKTWDGGGIAFDSTLWAEVLRVAKPGAFLLAFGGTRTYHRLTCSIEDAGWEIRDCLMWLYGSGFPKSYNISKAIDRKAGAKRNPAGCSSGPNHSHYRGARYRQKRRTRFGVIQDQPGATQPGTSLAEKWSGWGTGLKPAWEPIVVAMKPLEGTFVQNALKHAVAGLDIDGSRIRYQTDQDKASSTPQGQCTSKERAAIGAEPDAGRSLERIGFDRPEQKGRWPANALMTHHPGCQRVGTERITGRGHYPAKRGPGGMGTAGHAGQNDLHERRPTREAVECWNCHPECPVRLLDEQSGLRKAGGNLKGKEPSRRLRNCYGEMKTRRVWKSYGDFGGASRFFYCAKASQAERNTGLGDAKRNSHPTVKPMALMKYLCTLTATPTKGAVLDPFAGSGTTLLAARAVGRESIGIEVDPTYVEIARRRLSHQQRALRTNKNAHTHNEFPQEEGVSHTKRAVQRRRTGRDD